MGDSSRRSHVKPPPQASSAAIAASMRGNRSKDTLPELRVRKELRRIGLRGYRKDVTWLPGRPDVVFTRYKLAILIHGCFWHRCPLCSLPIPKTNTAYWQWKFSRNVDRDRQAMQQLKNLGWHTLRIWGCEVSRSPVACAVRIKNTLDGADVPT